MQLRNHKLMDSTMEPPAINGAADRDDDRPAAAMVQLLRWEVARSVAAIKGLLSMHSLIDREDTASSMELDASSDPNRGCIAGAAPKT